MLDTHAWVWIVEGRESLQQTAVALIEAAAAEGAAIDQVLLEKTLGSYEEKERRFQELKETKPLFTNPLR